jgi:hypothetical protein
MVGSCIHAYIHAYIQSSHTHIIAYLCTHTHTENYMYTYTIHAHYTVCTHTHTYTYIHTCMHITVPEHPHPWARRRHVQGRIYIYIYIYIIFTHIHTHVYTHKHTPIHTYIHTCMHTSVPEHSQPRARRRHVQRRRSGPCGSFQRNGAISSPHSSHVSTSCLCHQVLSVPWRLQKSAAVSFDARLDAADGL